MTDTKPRRTVAKGDPETCTDENPCGSSWCPPKPVKATPAERARRTRPWWRP